MQFLRIKLSTFNFQLPTFISTFAHDLRLCVRNFSTICTNIKPFNETRQQKTKP